jgi:hypothetical protein
VAGHDHGHYLTIVWDADGSHYGAGAGFTIYQDCAVLLRQATLGSVDVPLAHGTWAPVKPPRLDNVFGNAAGATYPTATASYTFSYDAIGEINDGVILYDRSVNGSPNNANVHNRWTDSPRDGGPWPEGRDERRRWRQQVVFEPGDTPNIEQ